MVAVYRVNPVAVQPDRPRYVAPVRSTPTLESLVARARLELRATLNPDGPIVGESVKGKGKGERHDRAWPRSLYLKANWPKP